MVASSTGCAIGCRPAAERVLREAVHEAIRRHKLLGLPIAVSRQGKVVWIPPEEIEVPPKR